jgi:hypothetical protein
MPESKTTGKTTGAEDVRGKPRDDAERASDAEAERAEKAHNEQRSEKKTDDAVTVEDVATQRGRSHPTPFGSGEPGEPETREQGMVRTGRALPKHDWNEDSAGLVPEETRRRQEQSREQRMDLVHELEAQGNAADGDSVGPRTTPRPHDDAMKAKEREAASRK